jgi:hypothetical protein
MMSEAPSRELAGALDEKRPATSLAIVPTRNACSAISQAQCDAAVNRASGG